MTILITGHGEEMALLKEQEKTQPTKEERAKWVIEAISGMLSPGKGSIAVYMGFLELSDIEKIEKVKSFLQSYGF